MILGCGGLDYSVVLFVEVINVKSVYIWIDVVGIFSIDLCLCVKVSLIVCLSFDEVVEMVMFGVKVLYFVIILFVSCSYISVFVGLSCEL